MKPSTRILLMQKRLLTPIFLGARLALWLDTADSRTITLDGSTTSEWRDKSGNGRHVSQLNKANQPTYTPNGIGGKPVLTFTGTNFLARTNDTFLQNAPAVSVFSVLRYTDYATSRRGINISSGGVTRVILLAAATALQSAARRIATETFSNCVGAAVAANTPVIHGSQLDFVNNSNTVVVNGVVAPAATFASGAGNSENALATVEIGTAITTQLFLGMMAETVFVNGILSSTELQQLTGYFAHKWRLTVNLPNNHPFRFRPPYM